MVHTKGGKCRYVCELPIGKFVGTEKLVFEVMGQVIQASMRELLTVTH